MSYAIMSDPIQIRMGGYGPATTGFSRALKFIGDRLTAQLGPRVEIKYVWNIMELGYRAEDILWLVEHGLLTLGYQSSSYLTDRVPELGLVEWRTKLIESGWGAPHQAQKRSPRSTALPQAEHRGWPPSMRRTLPLPDGGVRICHADARVFLYGT